MMKKKFLLSVCVCLMTFGFAAARVTPADIITVNQKTTMENSDGMSVYTLQYPIVKTRDNVFAGQKISYYFSHNVDRYVKVFTTGKDSQVKRTMDRKFAVKLNDGKYLSILEQTYVYVDHAAHPSSGCVGATFDLQTGKRLSWQQIVRPEDEKYFTLEAVNAKLLSSEYGQKHYFYNDFKGLKNLPNNYYLDAESHIHFLFGQYEIAPYVVGIIDIDMEKTAK
ncbi:RsiV family protein [Megasphaera sueciensis]|uniref:RsiV family protein n=1 Tax=Megasphaera sueciensis TaxID=349094 RepID=UPI003D09210D